MTLNVEFVEFIPEVLEDGHLYISIKYRVVCHLCCCGCGEKVVTPLSPTDWKMTYDGKSVSLHPSIGNWSYPCRSHYWIQQNEVRWSYDWSDRQIEDGRRQDQLAKEAYYNQPAVIEATASNTAEPIPVVEKKPSLWARFQRLWR